MTYSQIEWLPITAGLAILGLIVSFFVWRRRGAAAGLRGVAWSLLPLAAYLIGAIELLWRFGTAIGNFAGSFVFSPKVWAGIIVVIVSVVLFAVAGRLRARGRRRACFGRAHSALLRLRETPRGSGPENVGSKTRPGARNTGKHPGSSATSVDLFRAIRQ